MSQTELLFQASNENAVAGFWCDDRMVVVLAAPILRRLILGKSLREAHRILADYGWQIEKVETKP